MSVVAKEICEKPFGLEEDLELCKLLQNREFSLNAVNHYGDNLLHICSANGCLGSVKMILSREKRSCVDRKNKFGWTPLMHAIRADEPETVKALLEHGADVTQRNYLGVSTLTLAAGVSQGMFEIIHDACPSMLKNSVNDDVTPLCVAAMKNDKNLFLKLMKLGLEVKNENIYTHLAMQHSSIPEIQSLANPPPEIQKYWNNRSDDIPYRGSGRYGDLPSHANNRSAKNVLPLIIVSSAEEPWGKHKVRPSNGEIMPGESKFPFLQLLSWKEFYLQNSSSISPNLIYNRDSWFAGSKNKIDENLVSEKQGNQPDDPKIKDRSVDHNASLSFTPEFSPSRSPCLPSDFKDEDVCGADTPTPPHYKTPPRGMVLNSDQAKLIITLRQFDLEHHISKFIEEEVDMSLFLTLNDQDLTEIGIQDERDRKALLAVIETYTKNENN